MVQMSLDQLCTLPLEDRSSYFLEFDPDELASAVVAFEERGAEAHMDVHRLAWALASNVDGSLAHRSEVSGSRQQAHGYCDHWPSYTAWSVVWSTLITPLSADGMGRSRTRLSELALSVACEQRQEWRRGSSKRCDTAAAIRAFEFLYFRDQMKVSGFCARLPKGADEPEGIANEAWARVFRDHWSAQATHRFLGLSSISSLVCQVSRNLSIDAYRKKSVVVVSEAGPTDMGITAVMKAEDRRPGPYAAAEGRQLGWRLRECMSHLSARRQLIAEMVWFKEISARRVSELLKVSEPAVSHHLKEARSLVGNCLKSQGFILPERGEKIAIAKVLAK